GVVHRIRGPSRVGVHVSGWQSGEPNGEFGLTTMASYAGWDLMIKGKMLATSESIRSYRIAALRRLIGRRLLRLRSISRSTGLKFNHGVRLQTATLCRRFRSSPHRLVRLPTTRSDD